MATLRARLDKMAASMGQGKVDTLAATIRSYLEAPPADKGNLEALTKKLQGLATRRTTRHAANFANDNSFELDANLAEIEIVLKEAMRTLRLLPGGKMLRPADDSSGWGMVVREWTEYGAEDAMPPRLTPSTHDIEVMERVLRLIWEIPEMQVRKVVMLKASGKSFRKLAKELHCSHEKVRQQYITGLMFIAKKIFGTSLTELTV